MECCHLAKGSIYLLFEHMSLVMRLNLSNLCFCGIKKNLQNAQLDIAKQQMVSILILLFLSKHNLYHCCNHTSKNDIDLKFTDISSTNDQQQIFV